MEVDRNQDHEDYDKEDIDETPSSDLISMTEKKEEKEEEEEEKGEEEITVDSSGSVTNVTSPLNKGQYWIPTPAQILIGPTQFPCPLLLQDFQTDTTTFRWGFMFSAPRRLYLPRRCKCKTGEIMIFVKKEESKTHLTHYILSKSPDTVVALASRGLSIMAWLLLFNCELYREIIKNLTGWKE
ncbi:unnamed protein product, partial [Thlaspi arvense]